MNRENTQALLADLEPMKEERQLKVVIDSQLEATLEKLIRHYELTAIKKSWRVTSDGAGGWAYCPISLHENTKYYLSKSPDLKITPQLIERFVCEITRYKDAECFDTNLGEHIKVFGENTGPYLAALIMRSYELGHNNFILPIYDTNISFLNDLRGKKSNLLNITVLGNLSSAFRGAKYVDAKILGSCSVSYVEDKIVHCIFRSDSEQTLKNLKADSGKSCKFYLINPDGTESLFAKI